ncbi:hypothetical protein EV697_102346 [Bisgaardia hudsonensis]|uniref:tRNA A-37 threonylcarbamoyl transferase component Bud32 n=1 Tax=Bisgaardia hudsonensis TaxID=109472 RepID=A0A4R2N1N9_9PAST|nr:protein kinase family protein [Bisgaardia hudsonensis]QLB12978.1 hypothetical protein A6A11_04815 [Bisgaardia hudsonensis]TCP13460.1 hypothetical protein EV697_102346 [Bisgaardia hudsonensis]
MLKTQIEFEQYIKSLLVSQKGKRIYCFQYNAQSYWLKQPEELKGIWRILKPNPKKSFIRELNKLKFLAEQKAPVPELVCSGKDFLVLKDSGKTVSWWMVNCSCPIKMKNNILIDVINAILSLHKMNLTHGRPAIRDIIWNNGEVLFIDFESPNIKKDLFYQRKRDILLFVYSLCREKTLSDEQIVLVLNEFEKKLSENLWQSILSSMKKLSWLYHFLSVFKPIAKTDLLAVYRLFENFSTIIKNK